ncbi:hypothetical protein H6758_02155 [Candidatus Nomurabacteria bacterium]|nr:hypothetical protein [Candidatus Nomurabacteria bacterium]
MSKKPPHLPNPTCRVDTRSKLRSVLQTLIFTIIGFLAGLAATLTAFAWIIPYDMDLLSVARPHAPVKLGVDSEFDQTLQHSIRQRMVTVYDARKKLSDGLYRSDGLLVRGLILSSDGWVLLPYHQALITQGVKLEMVDHLGKVHIPDQVVTDPLGQFVYAKFEAQGLGVIEFENFKVALDSKEFSVFDGNHWSEVLLSSFDKPPSAQLVSSWQSGYGYRLLPDVAPGAFVFSQSGKFVGVVGDDSHLVFGHYIAGELESVIARSVADLNVLPVRGMFVNIHDPQFSREFEKGFYVFEYEKTWKDAILQEGDVIVAIEGETIIPEAMDIQVQSHKALSLEMDVIRDTKLIRVQASLSSLNAILQNS